MPAFPGDTAAAGLARLDWAMPDDASAVIVELGANDALQGLDPAGDQGDAREDHHRAEGARAAHPARQAWRRRAIWARTMWTSSGRSMPTSPQRYDLILYPFFLDGVALDDKYTLGDGHSSQR